MNRSPPRALLLEHDDALRQLFVDALTHLGCEVVAAPRRKQALELLLHEPEPDLIIVDVVDPRSEGTALLSFLGQEPESAGIPLILMTDGNLPELIPGAVRLSKPFGLEELEAALRESMRDARMRPGTQATSELPGVGG